VAATCNVDDDPIEQFSDNDDLYDDIGRDIYDNGDHDQQQIAFGVGGTAALEITTPVFVSAVVDDRDVGVAGVAALEDELCELLVCQHKWNYTALGRALVDFDESRVMSCLAVVKTTQESLFGLSNRCLWHQGKRQMEIDFESIPSRVLEWMGDKQSIAARALIVDASFEVWENEISCLGMGDCGLGCSGGASKVGSCGALAAPCSPKKQVEIGVLPVPSSPKKHGLGLGFSEKEWQAMSRNVQIAVWERSLGHSLDAHKQSYYLSDGWGFLDRYLAVGWNVSHGDLLTVFGSEEETEKEFRISDIVEGGRAPV
jgi:hypothetical protein